MVRALAFLYSASSVVTMTMGIYSYAGHTATIEVLEIKEITLKRGGYGNYQHPVFWIYYSGQKTSYNYHYADEIAEWIEKYLEQGYRIIIENFPKAEEELQNLV